MERITTLTTEIKSGKEWLVWSVCKDPTYVYQKLATVLTAKYQDKATWVRRCVKRCNYDGTYTYTIYYDSDYRDVFLVTF